MSIAAAFASIGVAFSRAGLGPYRDAEAIWPGAPVYDDGGSIVDPGTPIVAPCQVQVDSASEAMRAEVGFRDTDVALVVLADTLAVSLDTDAEIVTEGVAYSVQSVSLDSMATHWLCRGRRASLKGQKAHVARLKRLTGGTVERNIGRALFVGGQRIQVEAQISITTGSASGRKTKKHLHVPSRPGEAPNQDTGVLGNNIETVLKAPLVVEVSSNATYSAALEFGTSRMAARPFMAPARDAKIAEVEKLVVDAVKRAVGKR